MSHLHIVHDSDAHFTIDPITRAIKNESGKVTVIQHDHNSERFTFSIQKQVDGHDMSACNRVEIHYINIDATDKAQKTTGFYEADDLNTSSDDSGKVTFSWLLSRNATQHAGSLNFLIRFACITDGVEEYAWHTAIFQGITVGSGMYNGGEEVIEPYVDVIAQWKNDLFGVGDTQEQRLLTVSAEQQAAIAAKGAAVLDSIPDEYEELRSQADENTRIKAGAIVLGVEGESIVVNDASDCYLQGLKLFGKSTQDGTPTPDAPVDIVSVENPAVTVCGKNLLNIDLLIDDNFVKNADGSYTMTKTGVGDLRFSAKANLRLGKGTYTLSVGSLSGTDTAVRFVFTHANGQEASHSITPTTPKTIHVTDNVTKFAVYISSSLADGSNITMRDVMLEVGSDVTDYEPYKATQILPITRTIPGIPVSGGGNYTDTNGQQWICDEVDLKRGVYVQRIATSNRVNIESIGKLASGLTYGVYSVSGKFVGQNIGLFSNIAKFVPKAQAVENTCYENPTNIVFVGSESDTLKTMGEKFNGSTVMYTLSAPKETPLSNVEIAAFKAIRSNSSVTTILNDTGAFMAVEYVVDTKTYIDNKIAEALKGSEQA